MMKVTTASGDYLVGIFPAPNNSVQCIHEEWDIAINVHR